jgi:hypothetical protein
MGLGAGLGVLGIETDTWVLMMTNMGVAGDFFIFFSFFLFLSLSFPPLVCFFTLRISNTKFPFSSLDDFLMPVREKRKMETNTQLQALLTLHKEGTCLLRSFAIKISASQACYNA